MEDEILQAMDKVIRKSFLLRDCQLRRCKKQFDAILKEREEKLVPKLNTLVHQMVSKRITSKEHSAKAKELMKKFNETDKALELLTCKLKDCKTQSDNEMRAITVFLSDLCENKKIEVACKNNKIVTTLMQSKEITPHDYMKVQSLVSSTVQKIPKKKKVKNAL